MNVFKSPGDLSMPSTGEATTFKGGNRGTADEIKFAAHQVSFMKETTNNKWSRECFERWYVKETTPLTMRSSRIRRGHGPRLVDISLG